METYREKEIIVFDLDGTLTESKGDVDDEMSLLLGELLKVKKIAIISGGAYPQIEKSLLSKFKCEEFFLSNLFLFPTSATSFYQYCNGKWKNIYTEVIGEQQRQEILVALQESLDEAGYKKPEKIYGEIIEDRGTQITFSGLGQYAPLEEKLKWDPDNSLRKKIIQAFEKRISDFDARIGGSTSIDINRRGIDKAYGIRQIEKQLKIPTEKMLFVGDTLFINGNDYAVISTGIDTLSVKGPEETKKYIREIIADSV